MEATTREIAFLIEKLIDAGLDPLRREGVHTDAAARRVLSYSLRLLGSRFALPQPRVESLALQSLRRKVMQQGHNHQLSRLDDLQLRLVMAGTPPETRSALFALLTSLPSQRDAEATSLPQLAPMQSSSLHFAPSRQPGPKQASAVLRKDPKEQPAGLREATLRKDSKTAAEARSASNLGEIALVREVLCACQGFDGQHVRYSPTAMNGLGSYEIAAEAGIPPVQRSLVLKLCEVGWLFRKLQSHAKEQDGGSAIRQAFQAALQHELNSLYQLMAQLDALAGHPLPAGEDTGAPYLTLRRLAVWLGEPMQRLRALAKLADAVLDLQGGQLISALEAATKHGEPTACGTAERCLRQACMPLLDMIRCWLFEGRLTSSPGDFFITASPHSKASPGSLWRKGYLLEEDMRPPFVSAAMSHKLLRGGKTLIFLRECCGDAEFEQSLARTPMAAAASQLSHGQTEQLERLVEKTAARIDRHVVSTLLDKYSIVSHCSAIKRYLLLSQGDFVAALMEGLGGELTRPSREISEYGLAGYLDAAIRASSAQYDNPDVHNRLRIRLDHGAGSETGWDVFSLRYSVEEPLATVMTDAAAAQIQAVARLLWALKRAEHSLSAAWLLLNTTQRTLTRLTTKAKRAHLPCTGTGAVLGVLKNLQGLRNEMAHLCTNLQAYLMFEVLERAWTQFTAEIPAAPDLDSLIGAHGEYVDALMAGALLCEEHEEVQRELTQLLASLLTLLPQLRRLHMLVEGAHTEIHTRVSDMGDRSRAGEWATTESDAPLRGIDEDEVSEVGKGLNSVTRDYETHLRTFVDLLPTQTPMDLNFLLFRLDKAISSRDGEQKRDLERSAERRDSRSSLY
ncbi:hypothetical protein COCSUDRAFT_48540 [Coccomyxa subellipsoidea C-169]|uniref:Uncharacterized protein n=1 Tax=Coccomyxa subellipsoidea (strain C-169) TaxID=574566 RepID=I0YQ42_COCSC|nr:hypothetical protein COCSUDRAFT_48540 [Coccomyxa subellipsoidea C-169]EIE20511.1 hypothetical protein COCSUDRAFT_48540 [Coccomyxa subellipsoidea C-169]|eukprot:XP_005645055.1 hypothetical protein COCSUDRAFT_48540 [Coccomyxa subellipsoidea C-169]